VVDTGEEGNRKFLIGMVLRYQLEVLLRKRAFLPIETEDTEDAKRLLTDLFAADLGDDGVSQRVLFARAAFKLMDGNGDGELSRGEMMNAFQSDERVRKLLGPLLPKARSESIYSMGDSLQRQIDAFDNLYKAIDSDGSGAIDCDEFEEFVENSGVGELGKSPLAPGSPAGSARHMGGTHSNLHVVHDSVLESISMSDFVAARNDARAKAADQRLTASDAPLLMGNSDGKRKVDLRAIMELAPHSVMHTMPLSRLHHSFRNLGLRHMFVTDTRNEVMGVITRKDLLPEVLEANIHSALEAKKTPKAGLSKKKRGSVASVLTSKGPPNSASLFVQSQSLL